MNNGKGLWHATRVRNLKSQRDEARETIEAQKEYIDRILSEPEFWIQESIQKNYVNEVTRAVMFGNNDKI